MQKITISKQGVSLPFFKSNLYSKTCVKKNINQIKKIKDEIYILNTNFSFILFEKLPRSFWVPVIYIKAFTILAISFLIISFIKLK